ncbi:hypothetical protein [Clostridium sp.]|uniref:hypothetical protein n=1 Tax=Clostridium sp. TaxID=1506 RepID=UPI0029109202|nr:hypothetical protein [Clostridium sp.]MDU4479363.1 hypothetical protein [Clostridium sp.]
MQSENKVVYDSKSLKIINKALERIKVNPTLMCTCIDKDNLIVVLDNGAVEILKAYFKSKIK